MAKMFRKKNSQQAHENQDEDLEPVLKEIKKDFIQDGQRWGESPEKRLVHLWKKYQRTSEEYKKSVEEIKSLKNQRKKEFDEMDNTVRRIRELSQSKEAYIATLKSDNEKSEKQIQQLKLEREAYLKSNQAIADLLITEGMTEFDQTNPQEYIKQLVKDRGQFEKEKKEIEERYGEFQILKAQELSEIKEQIQSKTKKLQEMKTELEELKERYKNAQASISSLNEDMKTKDVQHTDSMEQLKASYEEEKRKHESFLKSLKDDLALEKVKAEENKEAKEAAQKALKISEGTLTEALKHKEEAETASFELDTTKQLIETLKKELNNESHILETKNKEVSMLNDEKEGLQEELQKVKSALSEAMAMNGVLEARISNLEREKQNLIEDSKLSVGAGLNAVSLKKEEEIQTATHKIVQLTTELNESHTEQKNQNDEIINLKQENKKLVKALEEAKNEHMAQAKKHNEAESQVSNLEEKMHKLETETEDHINRLSNELNHYKDENETMKNLLDQEVTKSATIQKHHDTESTDLKKELEKVKNEFSLKQQHIAVATNELEIVQKEKNAIQHKLQSNSESTRQLCLHLQESVKKKMNEIEIVLSKVQQCISSFQESFDKQILRMNLLKKLMKKGRDVTILQLEEKANDASHAQSLVKQERDTLKTDLTKLYTSCASLEEKLKISEKEKKRLEGEIKQIQENAELQQTTVKKLNEEKQQLQQEIKRLKEQAKNQKSLEEKAQTEMKKASKETNTQLELVKQESTEIKKQMGKVKNNNQNLSKRVSALEADLSSKQQMLTTIQKNAMEEKSVIEAKIQNLQEEKMVLQAKANTEEKRSQSLRLELDNITMTQSLLKTENNSYKQDSTFRHEKLQAVQMELGTEQRKVHELQQQLTEWQMKNDLKEHNIAAMKNEIESLRKQAQDGKLSMQQSHTNKKQCDYLSQQLKIKQEEYTSLAKKMEASEIKLQELSSESSKIQIENEGAKRNIDKLQSSLNNTRKILHSLEEDKRKISKKYQEVQDSLAQASDTIKTNRQEITRLHSAMVEKDSQLTQIQSDLVSSKRHQLELENEEKTKKLLLVRVDGEVVNMKEKLETMDKELLTRETTIQSLGNELSLVRGKVTHLNGSLLDRQNYIGLLENNLEKMKAKNVERKHKLSVARQEGRIEREKAGNLADENTELKLKCQELSYQLEDLQLKYTEKQNQTEELLQMSRSKYQKKRQSMSSTIDRMSDDLITTKSKLEHEIQWQNHASGIHQQLLKDKHKLHSQIGDLEKALRDKSIRIIELEAINNRLQLENKMIEDKLDESLNSSLKDSLVYSSIRRPVSTSPGSVYNSSYSLGMGHDIESHRLNRTH